MFTKIFKLIYQAAIKYFRTSTKITLIRGDSGE